MKEELNRILGLLEDGKINADEAERLIRAMNGVTTEFSADPFRDAVAFYRTVRTSIRKSAMRRTKSGWKAYYGGCGWWEQSKEDSKKRPLIDRLRGCFRIHGLAEPEDVKPEAHLEKDLEIAADDRTLLRHAINSEFEAEPTEEDATSWETVADILAWLEPRVKVEDPVAEPAPVAESDAPVEAAATSE